MTSQRYTWLCILLVGVLITSVVGSVNANTITTGGPWPATAEVIAATADQVGFGDDANVSLAQTFSVESAFSAQAIFLVYENDTRSNVTWNLTMTLFEVADVHAVNLEAAGAPVFTDSFTFPPVGGSDTIARIDLDTPLPLDASVGTAGYALQISGTDFNPGWEWLRTSSAGNVYGGGQAYEDGAEKGSGVDSRDFSLAVSSVPEPAGMALVLLGGLVLTFRRKR